MGRDDGKPVRNARWVWISCVLLLFILAITVFRLRRPFYSAKSYGFMGLWLGREGRNGFSFPLLLKFKLAYYLCYTRSRIPDCICLHQSTFQVIASTAIATNIWIPHHPRHTSSPQPRGQSPIEDPNLIQLNLSQTQSPKSSQPSPPQQRTKPTPTIESPMKKRQVSLSFPLQFTKISPYF